MKLFVHNDEVARLEAELPLLDGIAQLDGLVAMAWYQRQRDTKRALALADEAAIRLADAVLDERSALLLEARLWLVRAEGMWLHARREDAERLIEAVLERGTALDDPVCCADAHWLRGCIAGERGDTELLASEMYKASRYAAEAGDDLRRDVADVAQLRSVVFADVHAAEAEWHRRFRGRGHDPDPAFGAWANDYLGISGAGLSDFNRAIHHAMRAHDCATATGQTYRAIIGLINAGVAFTNVNDHVSALECMQRALDLARSMEWPVCIGLCLSQVADPLRALGRHDVAGSMVEEALIKLRSLTGSRNYLTALQHLGDLDLDRHRDHAALQMFEQLEEGTRSTRQIDLLILALRGKAKALSRLARPKEALEAAEAALAVSDRLGDAYYPIDTLMVLAEIHARHSLPPPPGITAPSAPLHYLNQALEFAGKIEGFNVPGELLDMLSREYARSGDIERAYQFLLRANAAHTKIRSQEATNHAIAMQVMHETERARAQLDLQRKLADAESRRASVLMQTTETLEKIGAIGQDITAHLDGEAVFDAIRRHVHGLLDVNSIAIYLLDADGQGLTPAYAVEDGRRPQLRHIELSSERSMVATCVRERREIVIDREPGPPTASTVPGTLRSSSMLYAPLAVRNRPFGAITIQTTRPHAYGEREKMVFRAICAYSAIALDNATAYEQLRLAMGQLSETQAELVRKNNELNLAYRRLEEMSVTDPLTGLRNRRFLTTQLDKDIAITLRRYDGAMQQGSGAPPEGDDLIFMMVDLDHFKSVNDAHGHGAGDAVLMQMRERLQAVCRDSDYLVRWGGEEFLVVARATRGDDAAALAERIRESVGSRPFRLDAGTSLHRTCSIGFACLPFVRQQPRLFSWLDVVDLADRALYLAKNGGRNAWVGLYPGDAAAVARLTQPMAHADDLLAGGAIVPVSNLPGIAPTPRPAD